MARTAALMKVVSMASNGVMRTGACAAAAAGIPLQLARKLVTPKANARSKADIDIPETLKGGFEAYVAKQVDVTITSALGGHLQVSTVQQMSAAVKMPVLKCSSNIPALNQTVNLLFTARSVIRGEGWLRSSMFGSNLPVAAAAAPAGLAFLVSDVSASSYDDVMDGVRRASRPSQTGSSSGSSSGSDTEGCSLQQAVGGIHSINCTSHAINIEDEEMDE